MDTGMDLDIDADTDADKDTGTDTVIINDTDTDMDIYMDMDSDMGHKHICQNCVKNMAGSTLLLSSLLINLSAVVFGMI
jgi:hypothetical protein